MMRAGVAALAAMLAVGAALSGCGGDAGDASLHELRRGNGSEPDSIDPQLARMEAAMTILRDCYEGLVSMDRDGTPVPGAAEGWTLSPDGRRYTFRLRADARWSNGDRVVAEDFVAAWRRLVDPATASQYALMLEPVASWVRTGPYAARARFLRWTRRIEIVAAVMPGRREAWPSVPGRDSIRRWRASFERPATTA